MPNDKTDTTPEDNELELQQQTVITSYGVECPQCTEWHESEMDMGGKTVECICGKTFGVAH